MNKPDWVCVVCGKEVDNTDGPFIDCNSGKECVIVGYCCNHSYTWHYTYDRRTVRKD